MENVKIEEYLNKEEGKQDKEGIRKEDEEADVKWREKLGDQIVNGGLIQFNEDGDSDEDKERRI